MRLTSSSSDQVAVFLEIWLHGVLQEKLRISRIDDVYYNVQPCFHIHLEYLYLDHIQYCDDVPEDSGRKSRNRIRSLD